MPSANILLVWKWHDCRENGKKCVKDLKLTGHVIYLYECIERQRASAYEMSALMG